MVGRILNQLACLSSNRGQTSESLSLFFFEGRNTSIIQTVDFGVYARTCIMLSYGKFKFGGGGEVQQKRSMLLFDSL